MSILYISTSSDTPTHTHIPLIIAGTLPPGLLNMSALVTANFSNNPKLSLSWRTKYSCTWFQDPLNTGYSLGKLISSKACGDDLMANPNECKKSSYDYCLTPLCNPKNGPKWCSWQTTIICPALTKKWKCLKFKDQESKTDHTTKRHCKVTCPEDKAPPPERPT